MSSAPKSVSISAARGRRKTHEKMGSSGAAPINYGKTNRRIRPSREVAEWKVAERWAPPRPLSDKEMEAAKKMFFDMDTDGSGSIDADELGVMMRSLGQNPTEDELKQLIKSVDEGDCDGRIQLREFLTLYTRGLDTTDKPGEADVNNCILAMGGDPSEAQGAVPVEQVRQMLREEYGLDIDLTEAFGEHGTALTKGDFERLLLELPSSPKKRRAAVPAA